MILISHRGNINGPNIKLENQKSYIDNALDLGFDVEIDVWYDNGWFLGHDKPDTKITVNWMKNRYSNLWVHCKNLEAIKKLSCRQHKWGNAPITFFWHQNDDVTLTSAGHIWTFPGKKLNKLSICVLPEKTNYDIKDIKKCFGVCSDYIERYKNL